MPLKTVEARKGSVEACKDTLKLVKTCLLKTVEACKGSVEACTDMLKLVKICLLERLKLVKALLKLVKTR